MDYKSLMEEAKAKQEEKTKKLAKMREKHKQSEIEQQRKVQEKQKQVQTKINKINRIKQNSNQLHIIDRKKQIELQTKQSKRPIGNKQVTKTADSVIKTTPDTINNSKPKVKSINNNTHKTTTTTTTPQIHTNKVEKNKVSNKPIQLPIKKPPPPNYNELMELAKQNLGKKDTHTNTQSENKFKNIPIPKISKERTEENTPGTNEKRKMPEDLSTKTQTQTKKQKIKDTPIDKKKTKVEPKVEPKEEPKPRRQIEQADFFKKTFDKSTLVKKLTPSIPRHKPIKQVTSRPEEQTSEDDDDFIVSDDDNPDFNVSAFIQDMFRYNKSKYADEEVGGPDESMVSSFTQQQYEERRSARIGKLEDLEDMQREEELLQKAARKKKNKGLKRLQ